jgi:hypothetical protein
MSFSLIYRPTIMVLVQMELPILAKAKPVTSCTTQTRKKKNSASKTSTLPVIDFLAISSIVCLQERWGSLRSVAADFILNV